MHDNLVFSPAPEKIKLSLKNNKKLPVDKNNLIIRALLMLKDELNEKRGMTVQLEKLIPMGAGLGGGSSNAATALKAGWLLWKNKSLKSWNPKKIPPVLKKCAFKLGADVPFFLTGGRAWAEGIGEQLLKLPDNSRQWLILIYPEIHVSTKEAYGLVDDYRKKVKKRGYFIDWNPINKKQFPPLYNSFEIPIFSKYPAIFKAKSKIMIATRREALMSGSGSSVYGFVKNKREGEAILRKLRRIYPQVFLVHTR